MMMTTTRLLLFRVFNITFGRFYFFAMLLKKLLVRVLIVGKKEKYVASSKFFDIKELDS
jgi:hypothetical protein